MDFYRRDPVLRLLPDEVPDGFLRLTPSEQAWRGRLWITMYGAGYEKVHAWWFVLTDNEEFLKDMRETIELIPDDHFALMMKARRTYEAGRAFVAGSLH